MKERRNIVDQATKEGGIENFKELDYTKFTSFLKQELLQLLEVKNSRVIFFIIFKTLSTINAFISFKKPALKDSQSFESNVQTELLQEVRGHRHICAAMIDSLSELTQHRQKILQEIIEDPSLQDLYEAVYQCETSFGSTLYKGANDIQMSYVVLYDLLLKNIDVLTNNALPSNKNKNSTSRVARNPRGKYSKKVL